MDLTRITGELDIENITDIKKRVLATLDAYAEMKKIYLLGMVYTEKNAKRFRLLC